MLVKTKRKAKRLVKRAFRKGFSPYNKWGNLKENIQKLSFSRKVLFNFAKSIRRLFVSTHFARTHGRHKGYVLFQEFLPNNTFDTRIVVLGKKVVGMRRFVRFNDFRASGSGRSDKDPQKININCVRLAIETAEKMKLQSAAFDFVFDKNSKPLIVEISYGFTTIVYPGYWDNKLNWHQGPFNSAEWMVEELIKN